MPKTIKDVFVFYNDFVKPIYCYIEAMDNILPIELLFEIHSAFDHIKKCYVDKKDEDHCCDRAIDHLKRGALDAYKMELVYFNKEYNKFLKPKSDLKLVDNGKFLTSLLEDRRDINKLATKARSFVREADIEECFESWSEVSNKINDFRENYFSNPDKVEWAQMTNVRFWEKRFYLGLIAGIISSIIAACIMIGFGLLKF